MSTIDEMRRIAKSMREMSEYEFDPEVHNLECAIDTLAAEVDELRRRLDAVRMGIGCARGQRTTQYCADVDARDEVIAEILAMLKPGEMPKYCSFDFQHKYRELYKEWQWKTALHARACEIAGRTE